MRCPRCGTDDSFVCKEGREEGTRVWLVHYCKTCDFHWRDTEPGTTVDPDLRPSAFQLDPNRLDRFEVMLPPKKS